MKITKIRTQPSTVGYGALKKDKWWMGYTNHILTRILQITPITRILFNTDSQDCTDLVYRQVAVR